MANDRSRTNKTLKRYYVKLRFLLIKLVAPAIKKKNIFTASTLLVEGYWTELFKLLFSVAISEVHCKLRLRYSFAAAMFIFGVYMI